jgi:Asp-tRNA(Asn)/Glu-tRNA(Gln) amidotransferase C subunit
MWFVRRCFRRPSRITPHRAAHKQSGSSFAFHDTDSYGIPVRPTWSVDTLLSSYPTPTISSATLSRLHELSALIPPADGSQEHTSLKGDVEDLVRLVEAVKLVDTKDVHITGACERHLDDIQHFPESTEEHSSGRTILDCASRTLDGFYVVDAHRKR